MFDCIIIGSGFGGSVLACRLAEKASRFLCWSADDVGA